MKGNKVFPLREWETAGPEAAGLSGTGLERARRTLLAHADGGPVEAVIVRDGRIVAHWHTGGKSGVHRPINSAGKSVFGNILGIAVAEGRLKSADEQVAGYYPEMMDVPPGEGPRDGYYAREKDRAITFRQLIANTSGYFREGQYPGMVFDYQTDGMNILTHALGAVYDVYDTNDPEGSPGFKSLVESRLGKRIGADFQYNLTNYNWCGPAARLNIFSQYCQIRSTATDMARLGWLWCNNGNWAGEQVIPPAWMEASVRTNPDIMAHCPQEDWKYGYGFWTNSHGVLWPSLPRSAFTAWGGACQFITCFPEEQMVVVVSSGPYDIHERQVERFLASVLAAVAA